MKALQLGLTAALVMLAVFGGLAALASAISMLDGDDRHALRNTLIASTVCVLATGLAVGVGNA